LIQTIEKLNIMKKLFFSFAFLVAAMVTANAQNTAVQAGAKIEFSKETHDYGNIKYDGEPYCSFEFKNTGDQPLIISNAKGSCGCTVPEWPKEPIAPGAKGSIRVKYDTKRPGPINKSVTINSNAVNVEGGISVLRIKGEVGPAPENGTPVNNSGAPTNN
jgi:hypothetical protein